MDTKSNMASTSSVTQDSLYFKFMLMDLSLKKRLHRILDCLLGVVTAAEDAGSLLIANFRKRVLCLIFYSVIHSKIYFITTN